MANWGDFTSPERWVPGQLVEINLPDRGIDGTYLIQRVTTTPLNDKKWSYHVEYGGRLLGTADFLKALVSSQQKQKYSEDALLHKFKNGEETTLLTDELLTTARSLTPFKCGDADAICGFVVCLG